MSDQKLLEKIRGLYSKAASSEFPAEADAFRAKAEELRVKWAIAEEALLLENPQHRSGQPILRTFDFENLGRYQYFLMMLFNECAKFNDCKVGQLLRNKSEVVGYPTDLSLLDILFTNLIVHMSNTVSPKPDPQKSEAENIYDLKMAGLSWQEVHRAMYPDVVWERRHGVRYTSVMRKYAEFNNLPRNMVGGKGGLQNYRDQFVESYTVRVIERLRAAKAQAKKEVGSGLVLANREERLNEHLWDAFPDLRPHPADCDCDVCHRCTKADCQRNRCAWARQPVKRSRASSTPKVRYHAAADAHGRASGNSADIGQQRIAKKPEQLR